MKKLLQMFVGFALLLAVSLNGTVANAATEKYERVTWDNLKSEEFNVSSVTEEDIKKAGEIADNLSDSDFFKKDNEGYATINLAALEGKYSENVVNVFKMGIANINLDIEKGAVKIDENNHFVKGENYDKYADNDTTKNSEPGGFTTMSCSAKNALKAMVGGAAGGALVGSVGAGAGAIPGAGAGAVTGGVGYYATCWW